jgi:hypothetical protein
VLTSLRRTSAGLEARLFNPNTHSVTALLGPAGSSVVSAQLVDFEHHAVGEPLPVAGGTARLDLGPKQICTVVFKF